MQPVTINFPCFILRCFLSLLPPTQVIGPPINAQSMAFGPSVSFEYPNNKVHWTKNRATSKNEFFIFAAQGIVHGLCQQWCIRFVELHFFVFYNHQWRLFVLLLAFQALAVIETERASVADAAPYYRGSVYQYNYSKSRHLYRRVLNALFFFSLRNGKGNDALK